MFLLDDGASANHKDHFNTDCDADTAAFGKATMATILLFAMVFGSLLVRHYYYEQQSKKR